MTVPIETSTSTALGNGVTTVFNTGFYFLDESELLVKLTPSGGAEVVQTLGVDYTVTMPATVGDQGSITMVVAPPVNASLVIDRDVPFTQLASFRQAGTFDPAAHEDAMDELTFQNQENSRRIDALESAGPVGSVVAGNGLSFSGLNLHVGAGDGIQVNADTVEVVFGAVGDLFTVGGAASAGVIDKAARADHVHALTFGAGVDSLSVGQASSPGADTYAAAADHVHAVPEGGVPEPVTGVAGSVGSSGLFCHSDHSHQASIAPTAEDIADTVGTGGVATTLSASDHVHAHGVRGGDTLHAVATTALAGFMSAADKTLLDAAQYQINTVQTTDATPTQIATFTPTTGQAETVIVTITAKDKVAATSGSYRRALLVSREAGVTTVRGAVTSVWTIEDEAAWDVTIAAATPAITISVTGKAAQNVYWSCVIERRKVVA